MSAAQPLSSFQITPLSGALGAEVTGLDVSRPLSAPVLERVTQAFTDHHMLCFRDQHLTEAQQIAFSRQFGALEAFPEKDKTKGKVELYHVANVAITGEHLAVDDQRVIFQRNNARWHTDSSYRYIPSLASIMYGVEVLPPEAEGGETAFSNMLMAYGALDAGMKARLEDLHMVHYYDCIRRLEPAMPPMTSEERDAVPPVTQPVVRVHPERGYARSLFFTTNTGAEIGGGTLEEGRALHRFLAEHASRPEFCYFHRWSERDLVMWDNRVLLHRAVLYDSARYRRVLWRTTVAGTGPVLGPFSRQVREAAA
jgi:taurine dioxygenase/alpha-ketoglutarate-dependent 2,4-dichlorophenoxyacetate dioxygenase